MAPAQPAAHRKAGQKKVVNELRTLFVINPLAGRGQCGRKWKMFEERWAASRPFPYEKHFTTRAGEAAAVSREAIRSGFTRIVAVGGDGTVHEVVNGTAGSDTTIGILPFGTGNDWARALRVPSSSETLAHMLERPEVVPANVALMNGRYFVNAAGIGFDGLVARHINHHPLIKRMGPAGYAVSAVKVLWSFVPSEIHLQVDGVAMHIPDTWMLAIGNGPFYGGGMKICPDACFDDDWLDICIVSRLGKARFLQLFPLVYSGKHVALDSWITILRGKRIQIQCPVEMVAHADGELIPSARFDVKISEQRLRFLRPPVRYNW
jgi:diacylglycerol kinase (ATP)